MSADFRVGSTLAALRRFTQPRPLRERCELCSLELAEEHAHLVELSSRRLVCVCDACAILFDSENTGKYRRASRRLLSLPAFRLSEEAWLSLGLPVNLAFFLHSTAVNRVVAFYPSPGGATEALPPPDAWQMVVEDNPILRQLKPDVEALIVNRLRLPHAYYVLGIDEGYKLVGLVRTHWRGLSGGDTVQREIERFFAALKERARVTGDTAHA